MEWYYAKGDEQRGPVSENVLIKLVQQGVIRADTFVWNTSMPDWLPYGEVQAQSDPLRTNDTVAAERYLPSPEDRTEPLAIASLVLAIMGCGCGFLVSIPAIICGHIAFNRINESGGRLAGRPLALGGLVIGYSMLVLSALGFIISIISGAFTAF